jgi:hypothetical protein
VVVTDGQFVSVESDGVLIWNVVSAPAGRTVFQVGDRTSAPSPDTLWTYVIGPDGEGAFAGTGLPLLKAVAADRFIGLEDTDFPRLGLYEMVR